MTLKLVSTAFYSTQSVNEVLFLHSCSAPNVHCVIMEWLRTGWLRLPVPKEKVTKGVHL